MRQRRFVAVAVLMLAQSTQTVAIGAFALFLPLIRHDLGITFSQAGAIAATGTLVYAFMQIPSGYIVGKVGSKMLLIVGLVGTNALTFWLSVLHDYHLILATQMLNGVFRAFIFAAGLVLIASLFPADRLATSLGLLITAGFSSSVFLNVLGPLLVGPLGWRRVVMLFSLAGFVILVLFWRLMPTPHPPGGRAVSWCEASRVFRLRAMWAVGTVQFVRLAVATGYATWLPTFLVDERGCSLRTAGLIVALSAILTAPSNFIGGYLSDRLKNPLLVIGGALASLAATTIVFAATTSLTLTIVMVACTGLVVQLYFGPLFAFPIGKLGHRLAGVTNGFGNCLANAGGFTSVYCLGALRDVTGSFVWGFYFLAALSVIGLVVTAALATVLAFPPPAEHEMIAVAT